MILDKQNLFSNAQAVTATAVSTDIIDMGPTPNLPNDNKNAGDVEVFAQVVEDFATLTSLTVTLQGSTAENFASPVNLIASGAIAAASLKKGYKFALDSIGRLGYRYLRLNYTVAGSDATAGKITAGLVAGHR